MPFPKLSPRRRPIRLRGRPSSWQSESSCCWVPRVCFWSCDAVAPRRPTTTKDWTLIAVLVASVAPSKRRHC
eukprot:258562-Alexandrium_andersonii.AAC.1